MENILIQRLEILKNAEQVTEKMTEAIVKFGKAVEKGLGIELTEDNAAMLVMHFAVALSRIEKGELVNKMEEIIIDELKQTKGYPMLPSYLKVIEEYMGYKIPDVEFDYIAAHFCLLVEKEV